MASTIVRFRRRALILGYIVQECLKGILKNKTVLLVTHQIDFLQNVDAIFVSSIFHKPQLHFEKTE
jgi:hypothetical protein